MPLFPIKKLKLVVSDFHLGKGRYLSDGSKNLLEDFNADQQFIDFMDYYLKGPYKRAHVELIFNGDFLNLLQIDYRDKFTDFITEGDSLHKLMAIIKGHQAMFDKIAEFSQADHHAVTFILGNHDPGFLWEGVQQALRDILKGQVKFIMQAYQFDGVHIEHGNQYHQDNQYDPNKYFLTEGLPEPIINLPFGSFLVIHYLNEIKKERTYFDKVYPFSLYVRWALIHDTLFAIRFMFKFLVWMFQFLLKPNPASTFSFWQILSLLKGATVHPHLHREAKKILFNNPETRIVVFGHTHQFKHINFAPGKDYFNSGTWNEKISLEVGSLGRQLKLTFVQIEYDKQGIPHGSLKEWKGRADVVQDVIF